MADLDQQTPPVAAIHQEYTARRSARALTHARWAWVESRIADARFVAFAAAILIVLLIYQGVKISPHWLWVPGLAFLALVLAHDPIRHRSERAGRARDFYDKGLERLEGRWAGHGVQGVEFLKEEHPYAADLDLFGSGSLFERLCTARTRSGEVALSDWLLVPANRETILERQAAIDELRPRLDLREDIELLGRDVRAGIHPGELIEWGAEPNVFGGGNGLRLALAILGGVGLFLGLPAFYQALFNGGSIRYFVVIASIIAFCTIILQKRVGRILKAIDQRTHDLIVLSGLLERIEREPFQSAALIRVKRLLETEGHTASRQIRNLARLLQLLDARRNQLFLPFALLMLWTEQIAVTIDHWRTHSGRAIVDWLAAVGEFEALCALAAYRAENPDDPFPTLETGTAKFSADNLGHPLIPLASCIRNDIRIGGTESPHALVVTGSNMSGKSTMLRTVGINVVLALAGAPVRATRLNLTPLAIGATLRIQDSLQSGKSRFFAEITRVRQIVEISRGPIPLLFLLDEIFHGTNSADRLIGAGSIVRGLLAEGAIGLVTTHDLALAEIADTLGERADNVHFEDRFEDGEIHFDYKMKPGVVRHSNALALMRSVGLEV